MSNTALFLIVKKDDAIKPEKFDNHFAQIPNNIKMKKIFF